MRSHSIPGGIAYTDRHHPTIDILTIDFKMHPIVKAAGKQQSEGCHKRKRPRDQEPTRTVTLLHHGSHKADIHTVEEIAVAGHSLQIMVAHAADIYPPHTTLLQPLYILVKTIF